MDEKSHRADAQLYSTSLDYTLKELQKKVKEHEAELEKIRSKRGQNTLPASTAGQARVVETALEEATNSDPFLPFSGSLLPGLLTLRKTEKTIKESRAYLASQKSNVVTDAAKLEHDAAKLNDQLVLAEALKKQISTLRETLTTEGPTLPDAVIRERLAELEKNKKNYDKETSKMMGTLMGFINEDLAPMLAAEELGGPVVGDMMDLNLESIAAGFNLQGKLKKPKEDVKERERRQRRIGEIWGLLEDSPPNEVAAASIEMKSLTEALLNQLAKANGDTSAAYVQLSRESAAARFLVRSKVAQFHPKDAFRLRLVDYGRELDA